MFTSILSANGDITGLILRITLALILFPHGAQKLLGWFGGYGFKGTMGFFTGTINLPYVVGLSVILIEFFSPILLVSGFAARIAALGILGLMIGIIFTSHIHNGFFMNWAGNQPGEGFEYHLLVIGLCIALLIEGAGRYSIDRLLVTD